MLATNAPKQVSSSSSSICLTMTVLPRRRRRDSNNEERELGFHACDWIPIKEPGCLLVVSKRLGSPYVSGRTGHWLKFKNSAALAVKREAEESMAREISSTETAITFSQNQLGNIGRRKSVPPVYEKSPCRRFGRTAD